MILLMAVVRRLDAVLDGRKQAVLDIEGALDDDGVVEQNGALRQAAGQAFYNTSRFTLCDLRARANREELTVDFHARTSTGSPPTRRTSVTTSSSATQIPRLSRADAQGTLIESSPRLKSEPGPNAPRRRLGEVKHPGLDNHGMGTIFEEVMRRFNEENNEEAGEYCPRATRCS